MLTQLTTGLSATLSLIVLLKIPAAKCLRCNFSRTGEYLLTTSLTPYTDDAIIHGLPIAVTTATGWSSTAAGAGQRLNMTRIVNTDGVDRGLGAYTGVTVTWQATDGTAFVTGCRSYPGSRSVVLSYSFPNGAVFSEAMPPDGLRTQFPAFGSSSLRLAGYDRVLSWEHDTMQPADSLTLGPSGGPAVFAASRFSSVLVVSPLDHFMTSSAINTTFDRKTAVAAWGLAATVARVPPGFVHRILLHEGTGVTQTMHEYGQLMQATAVERGTTKLYDITLRRLGYSTDNGAMYCYCKQHCDTTLLAVKDGWDRLGIPMAYLTFEGSWFENNWSSMWCVSDLRPNEALDMDLPTFVEQLKAPIHGYVPYFCNDSSLFGLSPPVTDLNGREQRKTSVWPALSSSPGYLPPAFGRCNLVPRLPFDFRIVAPDSAHEFFTWLFERGFGNDTHPVRPGAGLAAFESDFFEEQYGCIQEFQTNVTAASVWLDGFTSSSAELQLPIQFSMATPSNLLQSLHQPAATNFRVSGDYANGASWDIGWSSMLVWALGAAPSKDTFWTNNQSSIAKVHAPECGGASGCPPDHTDAGCELHSMLAALSTGPIQPSDSVGNTDKALLSRCMRKDGLLLQPSKPLTVLDRVLGVSPDGSASNPFVSTKCCQASQGSQRSTNMSGSAPISGGQCGQQLCSPSGTTVLGTFSSSALPGPPAQPPEFEQLQWAWYFLAHSLATQPFSVQARDFWPPLHFGVPDESNGSTSSGVELVYREWHEPRCKDGEPGSSCTHRAVAMQAANNQALFEVGDPSLQVFDPQLVTVVPIQAGFAFLGEMDKYASLSRQRFTNIEVSNSSLRVMVSGAAGEDVAVTCLVPHPSKEAAAIVSRRVIHFSQSSIQQLKFVGTPE